jgi:hypothetical protein
MFPNNPKASGGLLVGLPCIVRNPRHYFSFQSRAKQRITLLVGSLSAEENPIKNYNFKKKSTQKKAASGHEKQMYYPIGEHFCFFGSAGPSGLGPREANVPHWAQQA